MLSRLTKRVLPLLMIMAIPLFGILNPAYAEKTGTLTGTVTDSTTGNPIYGASVIVVGTAKGAKTDQNGKYTIKDIPIGTYPIRITSLGYAAIEQTVTINPNRSFTWDIGMSKAATDTETITVKGTKDIIDRYASSNEETISKLPETRTDQLLKQVPELIQGSNGQVYIRGGRAGETSQIIDGAPINNPLGGLGQQAPAGQSLQKTKRAYSGYTPQYEPYPSASYGDMYFQHYGTNPFVDTDDDHLSTFAVDVDDASYSIAKSYIERNELPPQDAVRVEEFINHFDYNYPATGDNAFGLYITGAPSRFGGENTYLLRIGVVAQTIAEEERKPANLVFVVDVSGSMAGGRRLEIVKEALLSLLDQLGPEDRVGIVSYDDNAHRILEPTSVECRREIERAISKLEPGGSTNAAAGLLMGYEMANRQFQNGHTNRVILCSDGVANVGMTGPDAILKRLDYYIKRGITLTTVGVGMGNYNDVLLEQLGDKGNGHYAYINSFADAERVFTENLNGTLQVVARDAKIQVDFDPEVVRSYRLLGYENRDVADKDFRNDRVDGGEVGSGQTVTALYEVRFYRHYEGEQLGTVSVRYKHPDRKQTFEVSEPIEQRCFTRSLRATSSDFMLAAYSAEFAEILRGSYWANESSLAGLQEDVQSLARRTHDRQIDELAQLIDRAAQIESPLAHR